MRGIVDFLSSELKDNEQPKVCIITHKNADPDAVASSLGMYYIVKNLCGECKATICFPEGTAVSSRGIIEKYVKCSGSDVRKIFTTECKSIDQNQGIVITVDAANLEQLGCFSEYIEYSRHVIVIDHHRTGELKFRSDLYVGSEDYSSTSEIIALILNTFLDRRSQDYLIQCLATILMAGIVYDSRRFLTVGSNTFRVMDMLESFGGNYFEALDLLEKEEDRSQRIAVLKAYQRIILKEICSFIVVGTHVGSFESYIARTLVNVGADVAIVLSDKKDVTRIALRSRSNTIDVSAFASWLVRKLGTGSGGGHFNSALFEGVLREFERSRDKKVKKLLDLFGEFCDG
ncbi:MAG: DHH family phosphoesterase [Desulfurococcales archaeon]|nr:DHH family phosphoesterase [Desulfurococcales archaeon]